ncbi:hypothetical protein GE09DRAFT_577621 [Coniochaeta sp. 2T2.1]|nr:hypothetical protein GE09DRAFT_577621 [Coniochaeta sp. 2T2.1]
MIFQIGNEIGDGSGYPHTIAAAFSVGELDVQSRGLLQALCFLCPDHIPEVLLFSNIEQEQSHTVFSALEYYISLGNLCKAGLVSQSRGYLTVNRLVQAIALGEMTREAQFATFRGVLAHLSNLHPRGTDGKLIWDDWAACENYHSHVLFLCKRYQELFRGEDCLELASVIAAATWYMFERGKFSGIEPLLKLAKHVSPDMPGLTQASVLFNLAGVHFECNRIEKALRLCNRALDLRHGHLDAWDPVLADTLTSIGIVYMEDGQLETAMGCHQRAIEIHERAWRADTHDGSPAAMAHMNQAMCYIRAKSYAHASTLAETAAMLFEVTSGVKSQKYGQSMYVIGQIREAQNRPIEALHAFKISLDVCRSATPDHFKLGLGIHKMAVLSSQHGDYAAAMQYLEEALPILQASYDPMPRVARTLFKMSEVLEAMGRADDDAEKRSKAITMKRLIRTFDVDPANTPEAFDALVPWFLR